MDSLQARDRQRFWHKIWTSAGRPRDGQLYCCYKLAKKAYRHVYHSAVNSNIQLPYRQLDFYLGTRSINKLWNLVRRSKYTSGSTTSDIKLDTLHEYYTNRFSHRLLREREFGIGVARDISNQASADHKR